jgi:hypothetical protein
MSHSIVIDTAHQILEKSPDPVPRLKILRDILGEPEGSPELIKATSEALASGWLTSLADEQLDHGGWARFHSRDSRSQNQIPTTEHGIEQAIDCGLRRTDPLLAKAVHYLQRVLKGDLPFPDRAESNDRWPTGRDLFTASTLAQIDPDHPTLGATYQTWLEITRRTFETGEYDAHEELAAHRALTGAESMADSYLVIHNRYAVTLLGCSQSRLSDDQERALMNWLWQQPRLGYLPVPPGLSPTRLRHENAVGWLRTQLILSRFRSWPVLAQRSVEELLRLRDQDGLWDFGPTRGLKLSGNWRRRDNRRIDQSVFVLRVLQAAGI